MGEVYWALSKAIDVSWTFWRMFARQWC